MGIAIRIVVVIAILGWLGFMVLGSTLAFPASRPPNRKVVQEQRSPSGGWVATLVEVSGGGAAGYQYQEVALYGLGSTDQVQVATRLQGVTLRWLDDKNLQVSYGSGKAGRTAVTGVAISYHLDKR